MSSSTSRWSVTDVLDDDTQTNMTAPLGHFDLDQGLRLRSYVGIMRCIFSDNGCTAMIAGGPETERFSSRERGERRFLSLAKGMAVAKFFLYSDAIAIVQ